MWVHDEGISMNFALRPFCNGPLFVSSHNLMSKSLLILPVKQQFTSAHTVFNIPRYRLITDTISLFLNNVNEFKRFQIDFSVLPSHVVSYIWLRNQSSIINAIHSVPSKTFSISSVGQSLTFKTSFLKQKTLMTGLTTISVFTISTWDILMLLSRVFVHTGTEDWSLLQMTRGFLVNGQF